MSAFDLIGSLPFTWGQTTNFYLNLQLLIDSIARKIWVSSKTLKVEFSICVLVLQMHLTPSFSDSLYCRTVAYFHLSRETFCEFSQIYFQYFPFSFLYCYDGWMFNNCRFKALSQNKLGLVNRWLVALLWEFHWLMRDIQKVSSIKLKIVKKKCFVTSTMFLIFQLGNCSRVHFKHKFHSQHSLPLHI